MTTHFCVIKSFNIQRVKEPSQTGEVEYNMWVKMDDINVEQKVFRENMYGILEPSSLLRRFETHQKVYFQNQNKSLQSWVCTHYKPG